MCAWKLVALLEGTKGEAEPDRIFIAFALEEK